MTTELDLLFTDIFHGFLDTTASRALGVPAAADCALLKLAGDTDEKDPRIVITAEVEGTTRSKTVNITAIARGTQPRAVTGPWLAKVGDRMADQSALLAYIGTLAASLRTGWQLEATSPPMPARIVHEAGGTIESGIGVRLLITV